MKIFIALLTCVCAAYPALSAEPAVDPAKQIVAEAAALGRGWDEAVSRLPELARTRKAPAPAALDFTLAGIMAGRDLRLQLLAWNDHLICGRAWIDKLDDTVRPVGVLAESLAEGQVSLRLVMAGVKASVDGGLHEDLTSLELTFSGDAKLTGRYTVPAAGPKVAKPLAQGAVAGTRHGLAAGAPAAPVLRAQGAANVEAARAILGGATGLLRLYRVLDIVLTQAAAPADAWAASRAVVPDFPGGRDAAKQKKLPPKKAPLKPELPPVLDAGETPSPMPEARADAGAEVADRASLAAIASLLGQMRVSAAAWVAALPTARSTAPGALEAAADPDFGPWCGRDSLASDATRANILPDDAEGGGSPQWSFVRNWRCVGPFPSGQTQLVSWSLPEFLDRADAQYQTDLDVLKREGATALPATPVVTWAKMGESIEEGLQYPLTERQSGRFGSTMSYTGPRNGCVYARTEVHAARDVELWVAVNASDFGRLWVNGQLVAAAVGEAGGSETTERIAWGRASLRKGANTFVVRCDIVTDPVAARAKRYSRIVPHHFWVKIAVHGRPLEAAAAKARQAAVAERQAALKHLPPGVQGYRNNNVAFYPDARPVTAWNLETGQNVIWRAHLELESAGGYGSNAQSSKASPVIMGDRLIVLREPHFVCCLEKATGRILWERECNVLEFTAPEKLEEFRRRWGEYVQARASLQKLGRDHSEREAGLMKQGMSREEARAEVRRVASAVAEKAGGGKKKDSEAVYDFLVEHGKFVRSAYGGWTGYAFAPPVTDGQRLWVKFGTGVAACFDRDGNRLWMVRIPAEGEYTVCPAPLLVAGRFIVEVGARSERRGLERFGWDWTRLIGLDASTGRELWRTEPLFHPSATSSSVAMNVTNGREELPIIVTDGGTMIRADDGKILSQTWHMDAGQGTATVGGAAVYHTSEPGLLTASRPVMYDRDSAGLQRLWAHRLPTGFDGGLAFADGLLYGSGGGQGMGGYVVFDPARRTLLRHEWPGHGERCTVWRGMPPQSNGRQYVPIVVAGDHVFIGEHGSVFHGPVARGAICAVVQRKWNGLLVGKSLVEKSWTGPPVFEGDRIYIRTDPSVVCIGYTGREGRAYEAEVNARYMLGDLEAQRPEETPPVDIAPLRPEVPANAPPFMNFISYPMERFGYFSIARADEVLKALGGLTALPDRSRPDANSIDVGGETITRVFEGNCGMYGRAALAENQHFRDVPTGKGAYFRAVLANDRERVVRVWAAQEPPDIWIAGQRVPEGTRVRLKRGMYTLLARAYHTEEWPVAPGFYFRLDDSSDVAAERRAWQEMLRCSRPELERIATCASRPAHVAKAKKLLAALEGAAP